MKTSILLTSSFLLLTSFGGDFLFKDGASDWKIVLPKDPQRVEAYAAGELQATIREIGGVELPIVLAEKLPEKHALVIGTRASPFEAVRKVASQMGCCPESADDIVAVKTEGGNVFFVANNPRATVYAVCHFLWEELGARWYWPGEDGTFLPKLASYEVKDLKWCFRPSFRYRELSQCSNHGYIPSEHWMARLGLNMGCQSGARGTEHLFIRRAGSHTIGINKEHFAEHPDWFALVDGKRVKDGVAGCWSNPGFTQAMVDRLVKMSRNAEILNAFPYDVCQRCECADCTKIRDRSSRWYEYYHQLFTQVKKVYPDLKAAGIAYQEYAAVPELPVKDLEYIEYCQYDRCYIHKLNDPNCPVNAKSVSTIKEWQKKATMGVYGYHFDIFDHGARMTPYWNMLSDEAKTFKRMGLVRMKTEMPHARPRDAKREDLMHISQRLCYYLYARLAWDANADVDALIADWCDHLFGAGSKPMQAYLKRFASAWDAMKCHVSYFGNRASGLAGDLMSQELVDFAHAQFDAAEAAIKAGRAGSPLPAASDNGRAGSPLPAADRALFELATERALFAQWEQSWAESKKFDVRTTVPKLPEGTSFDKVPEVKVTGEKGTFQPTTIKMYATDEALHIQVVSFEKEMDKVRKGETGKDVPIFNADNIELFVGVGDGMYRQLGVNFAGGTYDAMGQDSKWNSGFVATTKAEGDRWTAEMTLPFKDYPKPSAGAYWRLSIIRNTGWRQEPCGFPAAIYRDLNLMAKVYFE